MVQTPRQPADVLVGCQHCGTHWHIECVVRRADNGHIRITAAPDDRIINQLVMDAHVGPMVVVVTRQ